MQSKYEGMLVSVVKSARLRKQLTRKQLAEKLKISQRHLTAIENEEQKPSFDLLFLLIRELCISSDMIFYPEQQNSSPELEELEYLLRQCNSNELRFIISTIQSMLKNKPDKG